MSEKSPAPTGPIPKAPQQLITPLGPRHRRLVKALLRRPITREEADRIAKASNAPHWIMELRRKGLNIVCERRQKRDSDGAKVHPGVYTLKAESIPLAKQMLAEVVE
ncbi:helix-turn-helix domain-containing protein [Alcanivorax sp. MM125-6]|nr:helix-turn-helix domain-containing protein [Alcanivorax sp. MM125-6]